MNIDEKLRRNWYLEQDEINTLIKRYKIMKYLNYVLLLIISVLLLTGCGIFGDDGSDVKKFEPYLIGAWMVNSPNEADYVGTSSFKQKMMTSTDTVEIRQPGQRSLKIIVDSTMNKGQFKTTFTDSTVKNMNNTDTLSAMPTINNPRGNGTIPFAFGSPGLLRTEEFIKARFDGNYNCNGDGFSTNNPIIQVVYHYKDDTIFRVYNIHVKGMVDTVSDLSCN